MEELQQDLRNTIFNWTPQQTSNPYFTALVGRFTNESSDERLFPKSLNYLQNIQFDDGSWGSGYFNVYDRCMTTAAVLNTYVVWNLDGGEGFKAGIEFLNKHLPQIIRNPNSQLVAYVLNFPTEIIPLLDLIEDDIVEQLQPMITKFRKVKEKLQSIDITDTYYRISLPAFDNEYLMKLDHTELISEDGSVGGFVGATAKLCSITDDENVKRKTLNFLEKMQNPDGGFPNFYGEIIPFLFGTIGLSYLPTDHIDIDLLSFILETISDFDQYLTPEGLPYSSSIDVGDLDDTCAQILWYQKITGDVPDEYIDVLEKYLDNSLGRSYISASDASTRSGRSVVEVGVMAKLLCVLKEIPRFHEYIPEIRDLIMNELEEHGIQPRWHVSEYYVLTNLIPTLEVIKDPNYHQLIKVITSVLIKQLPNNPTGDIVKTGRISDYVYALYAMAVAELNFDWVFESIDAVYKVVEDHRDQIDQSPRSWRSISLEKYYFTDRAWCLISLLSYQIRKIRLKSVRLPYSGYSINTE